MMASLITLFLTMIHNSEFTGLNELKSPITLQPIIFKEARTGERRLVPQCGCSMATMPPCDFQPEPYKGLSYAETTKIRQENLTPALLTYYRKPLHVHQGHMQWLFDAEGTRYLDMMGGIVTISVGHCHPKVNEAAFAQMKKLWHTTNIYMHPKIHEYAKKLADKLPDKLKVVYFVNSGSEANDLAVLMARMHTGVYDILSLRNAYHGGSPVLMGLTAMNTWKYNVPTGFGMKQTMNPDPFRGPWGGKYCRDSPAQTIRDCDCAEGHCKATDMYVEQLEDVLRFSMPKGKIGAFFAESIQGGGGTVQFTKGFVKRAFEKVRKLGGVCISDEVQTGFGRTGSHYWGFEGHDVVPDIAVMAKGIGNGFPLAAVVTTPEIAATMGKALHFNTYGGNPVGCAIGCAVLDVIDEENLQAQCHTLGTYYIEQLATLRDEFEVIGDVRGKGLMIGVELVTDKESRTPLSVEKVGDIWEDLKDRGVLVGKGGVFGHVFRIKPPMCITKEDIDFTIATFRDVLQKNK